LQYNRARWYDAGTDTSLTRYLYTGREFDTATGLQYNRNRWYDPATGRWINQDPIGIAAGDGNLYRYVGNSPTNWIDPDGLAVTAIAS
jgi:RHS repeat-associated protein